MGVGSRAGVALIVPPPSRQGPIELISLLASVSLSQRWLYFYTVSALIVKCQPVASSTESRADTLVRLADAGNKKGSQAEACNPLIFLLISGADCRFRTGHLMITN
jgi:hypothetical protein